jgi:hypothetical protein
MRAIIRGLAPLIAAAVSLATATAAQARVLHVGPGQRYKMPCDAIAAARPGDQIQIDARGNP